MAKAILLGAILILISAVLLILKKEEGTADIVKDIFSSKTIFAFMLYGTFSYLAITGKIEPIVISNIVFSLMSFYYGMKVGQQTNGGGK